MQASRKLFAVCCLAFLGGCATSRSYMRLDVSHSSATVTTPSGKAVVIDAVKDERRFEESPGDPSVPSLKPGDEYKLGAEERKRAIARKRNGWGKAMGDILLENGETVETLTHDLVADGFARHGYQVLAPGVSAPPEAVHVTVRSTNSGRGLRRACGPWTWKARFTRWSAPAAACSSTYAPTARIPAVSARTTTGGKPTTVPSRITRRDSTKRLAVRGCNQLERSLTHE